MQGTAVSSVLRERLGFEATGALVDLLDDSRQEWQDEVLSVTTERFGRVVAEESAKLRVELAGFRAELLKWSFLFWIGQVAAVAGLLAFMLRR
jgi:hypothetical protein